MAHARMYSDDDPYRARLRDVSLTFPESCQVEAWGRPTFLLEALDKRSCERPRIGLLVAIAG